MASKHTATAVDRAAEIVLAHRTGFMPKPRSWHDNSEMGIKCYGCDRTWLFADDPNAGETALRHVAELMAAERLIAQEPATDKAEFYKNAAIAQNSIIHDTLAEALGFPPYAAGEPGYSPDKTNYVTGDHTAESLAAKAAEKLQERDALVRESALISARIAMSEYDDGAVVLHEKDFTSLEQALKAAIGANSTAMDSSQYAEIGARASVSGTTVNLELTWLPEHVDASLITALVGVDGAGSGGMPIDAIRNEYAKMVRRDYPSLAACNHRFIFLSKEGE